MTNGLSPDVFALHDVFSDGFFWVIILNTYKAILYTQTLALKKHTPENYK